MLQRLKWIFRFMFARPYSQRFFRVLHQLALGGMNIGSGSFVKYSGELSAASIALRFLSKSNEKKPCVIFDVGANVGDFSQEILPLLAATDYAIHCFEPSRATYEKLKCNPAIAAHASRFRLINQGLGESEGSLSLYTENSSGMSSLYDRNVFKAGWNTETVLITTLDAYCQSNQIQAIDYLKLDIEGHEYMALLGAKQLIQANAISFIQFEFGGANVDSKTYLRDFFKLLDNQYHIYRILFTGLAEVSYSELAEVFVTTNFLAVRKNITL